MGRIVLGYALLEVTEMKIVYTWLDIPIGNRRKAYRLLKEWFGEPEKSADHLQWQRTFKNIMVTVITDLYPISQVKSVTIEVPTDPRLKRFIQELYGLGGLFYDIEVYLATEEP